MDFNSPYALFAPPSLLTSLSILINLSLLSITEGPGSIA
jgi:hypothetical protein